MTILIVTAHPSSKGFTHQIAKKLRQKYKEEGLKVECIDLYNSEFVKQYVTFENSPAEIIAHKHILDMQQKIKNTKKLILVYPMWNFDMPAIMKNWFDSTFTAHFAFKYSKSGMPQGLLKNIEVSAIITANGPEFYYKYINKMPIKSVKVKFKTLCQIKSIVRIIGKCMKLSSDDKEKILDSL